MIKQKTIKAFAVVDKKGRIQRELIGQLEIYDKRSQAETYKWDTYPVEIIVPVKIKIPEKK